MTEILNDLLANILFVFERIGWLDIIDLLLVSTIFFLILRLLRDTQAMVLLRGILLIIAIFGLINTLDVLPAFSWLVQTTLPSLLIAIPVIFAPEIRRALERLGRAGEIFGSDKPNAPAKDTISSIVTAAARLSDRQHGALIVLQRLDSLEEYSLTGVKMDSIVTPELLLQIFYPNTPLHDGAAIVLGSRIIAASCVLPLSASGVLTRSPERQMGLRHRAALGISEVSDAVAVIVSEETGSISIVHAGRMIRRLDPERLENILRAFFKPSPTRKGVKEIMQRFFNKKKPDGEAK